MEKKTVLFVLIDEYADWEAAFIAPALQLGVTPGSQRRYQVKTVAKSHDPLMSGGGFRILPDYSIEDMPENYAAIVLIGGVKWSDESSMIWKDVVIKARKTGKIVAGICNGASFLAKIGLLNHVKHTGNGLEQFKVWGGESYTNEAGYVELQSVFDDGIVTANGTAQQEFCRDILMALQADTIENIWGLYHFSKEGYYQK